MQDETSAGLFFFPVDDKLNLYSQCFATRIPIRRRLRDESSAPPECVLLAKCSNCTLACACANCQTPDATVIFALQLPPPFLASLPSALLFIPDYRLAEGLSNRIPHNQSQDFSTTSSHNSSERSGSLSGWFSLRVKRRERKGIGRLSLSFPLSVFLSGERSAPQLGD